MLTLSMSIPRPNKSVATRIRLLKLLKAWYLASLGNKGGKEGHNMSIVEKEYISRMSKNNCLKTTYNYYTR